MIQQASPDYAEWEERLTSEEYGQAHLLRGLSEEDKHLVIDQLSEADKTYPGGLLNYLTRARKMLAAAEVGSNPFDGFVPTRPSVVHPSIGSPEFFELERSGLELVGNCGFVLVAGGLGERLGYPDIKIGLQTNVMDRSTYCQYYFACIKSLQRHASAVTKKRVELPIAIMTSGDTRSRTMKLLHDNDYYGLNKSQVTVMMQKKVPALIDSQARIGVSASDRTQIETKPHGHGDVHTLLHQHDIPKKWLAQGIEWLFFFQDTNALSLRALPVLLAVSKLKSFHMNSLCIPRTPCEAVGGICHMYNNQTGQSHTVNVEYNQLDSLLKSSGLGGDVAEPNSKYSMFPGNCNILAFQLKSYSEVLDATKGTVPEFVNPKYVDESRIAFKSAARLECMMQDFARLYKKDQAVGATVLDRWFCFSCVKNNIADASAKISKGIPGECALTAEFELYQANARCLTLAAEQAGTEIHLGEPKMQTFCGLEVPVGPRIVLDPSWALTITQMISRLKDVTRSINISQRSSLSLVGDIIFESLDLDGDLALRCSGHLLETGSLVISNKGSCLEEISLADESVPLTNRVRGFRPVELC